jgi:hypothetical protein
MNTTIKKLCKRCNKALVNIGDKRINGKDHKDWETRIYHKKCWKEMIDEKYAIEWAKKYLEIKKNK